MLQQKVYQILIGDGANSAAPITSVANIANGDIAVVKRDMTILTAGETISDSDVIYVAQGTANGPIFSAPILGASVSKYEGQSYATKSKQTVHVGYNRGSAASINVANDTEYSLSIIIKHDKQIWSKRQLRRVFSYVSDSTATAKEICENLAALIIKEARLGNPAFSYLDVTVVGDGTGDNTTATVNGETVKYHDITGVTKVGLEITSKEEAFNGLDKYERVYFEVKLSSGFDATTVVTETQSAKYGSGEYGQIYDLEKFAQGYKGITNYRKFPIPTPTYYASTTGSNTSSVANGIAVVAGDDEVTFDAGHSVVAGNLITITDSAAGVGTYEVKYFISANVAVLTSAFAGTTDANADYTVKEFYDMIVIDHADNAVSGEINGRTVAAPKRTIVAMPAGAATQSNAVLALLNPYMASVPGAFANISL